MMRYKNTIAIVRSNGGDNEFDDTITEISKVETLTSYLLIIGLDYILRRSIDLTKVLFIYLFILSPNNI